jgi:hypothetical protein
MLRKPLAIVLLFLLTIFFWWIFQTTRPLPGVEPKGGAEDWAPWISLATSVVTLLAGIAGLALKLVEMRTQKPQNKES